MMASAASTWQAVRTIAPLSASTLVTSSSASGSSSTTTTFRFSHAAPVGCTDRVADGGGHESSFASGTLTVKVAPWPGPSLATDTDPP